MRNQNHKGKIRLLLIPLFLIFISASVSASSLNIGYSSSNQQVPSMIFIQGQPIDLVQTCDYGTGICDSCNITSIKDPTSSTIVSNAQMTLINSQFNYTFSATPIGTYTINGVCSGNGSVSSWTCPIVINASGSNMDIMFILFFILSYGLFAFALYIKNPYLGIFSGILLVLFGAFVYNQGFNSQRNFLTESIAFVTIALGLVTMTIGALEGFDHS